MIQYQEANQCTKLELPMMSLKNDVMFRKYDSDVTMITSLTQNYFLSYKKFR